MLQETMVEIFKALSDPNRLHLMELLMDGDRTNSELMSEVGLSQNLLSHHLNVLTEAGLVTVQQSIGDARRRYYSPSLAMLGACCLWWKQRSPCAQTLPTLRNPQRVLFLCAKNGARSLIAEALAHHMAPGSLVASSAGLAPSDGISPLVLQVLGEHLVPAHMLRIHTYQTLLNQPFDYVVTVCDKVHEHLTPELFNQSRIIHWSLHDESEEGRAESEQLEIIHELYHDIEQRLLVFVQRLAQAEQA
ncbi:MAG TPA: metalloregulator ArsR/SmtB family transcription factor [Aggregatilineaceae bacterium]|nr:metalloregulator ArsR/SmtB family transcription factor [Aggregatilineaceae bacterium]